MKRLGWISFGLILTGGIAGLAMTLLSPDIKLDRVDVSKTTTTEPTGMCPWRNPASDMQTFFPSATTYRPDLLILSDLRLEVIRRLGPGTAMDTNGLDLYRVFERSAYRGTVLVQRAAGQYGAVEVVVGVRPDGTITGVMVQRMREPAATAHVITSPAWLGAFRGKTANSAFRIGDDLPKVPESAQITANIIARTVRTLLIEFDIGEHRPGGKPGDQHANLLAAPDGQHAGH